MLFGLLVDMSVFVSFVLSICIVVNMKIMSVILFVVSVVVRCWVYRLCVM